MPLSQINYQFKPDFSGYMLSVTVEASNIAPRKNFSLFFRKVC